MVLMKPDPFRKQKVQARAYQPSLNPVKSQEACEFKSTDNSSVFPRFLMWVSVVQGSSDTHVEGIFIYFKK